MGHLPLPTMSTNTKNPERLQAYTHQAKFETATVLSEQSKTVRGLSTLWLWSIIFFYE
jgi:hypothetical protein